MFYTYKDEHTAAIYVKSTNLLFDAFMVFMSVEQRSLILTRQLYSRWILVTAGCRQNAVLWDNRSLEYVDSIIKKWKQK